VWKGSFINVLQAIEIEKKIKRWSAKKKKALIEEQWDLLKELSKKGFD
jgi:putative endonuclease